MMVIEFVRKLGDGWRLEVRKAGVVIGAITENEGQYFFYQGTDIKLGSPVLRDANLERLRAAVERLF
jgi:hypothetical protein